MLFLCGFTDFNLLCLSSLPRAWKVHLSAEPCTLQARSDFHQLQPAVSITATPSLVSRSSLDDGQMCGEHRATQTLHFGPVSLSSCHSCHDPAVHRLSGTRRASFCTCLRIRAGTAGRTLTGQGPSRTEGRVGEGSPSVSFLSELPQEVRHRCQGAGGPLLSKGIPRTVRAAFQGHFYVVTHFCWTGHPEDRLPGASGELCALLLAKNCSTRSHGSLLLKTAFLWGFLALTWGEFGLGDKEGG